MNRTADSARTREPEREEELFEVFDPEGRLLGLRPRSEVHRSGAWHRSVNLFLFDGRGRLWLQRRAQGKDVLPGRWDLSVAEHLQPGEDYDTGIRRGLREELGIAVPELAPLGDIRRFELHLPELRIRDRELQMSFRAAWSGELFPDPAEVADLAPVRLDALRARIVETPEDFTPWLIENLDLL